MKETGAFGLGLFFSLTTATFWGVLPVALKLSSHFADPVTLTWFRFLIAGILVFFWQYSHGKIKQYQNLTRKEWFKLGGAGVFLIMNYTCYAWSLNYLSPEAAQLCMQSAPLFLAIGGAIFFKEYLSGWQCCCFVCLVIGLIIFFHPVFDTHDTRQTPYQSAQTQTWLIGLAIVFTASLTWSFYALIQKSIFAQLDSSNILLGIYIFATIVMWPASHPILFISLSMEDMIVVLFCALNTVIAYGAFAKSLTYWSTVQVSSMIALTPIISYVVMAFCVAMGWWTDVIHSESVDALSVLGMCVVVAAAIGMQRKKKQIPIPHMSSTT